MASPPTLRRPRVLLVQRRLTNYRVALFEHLRELMDEQGLELVLACGQATPAEQAKGDAASLPWAHELPTRYFLRGRLCWQPFGHLLQPCDLAVVTLENKLLYNLWLQFGRRTPRVGLWGHGANLQGRPDTWRERFKRRVLRHADWWFAYTEHSLPYLKAAGFPPQRTTVLNNALDTRALRASLAALPPQAAAGLRAELGLGDGPLGLYLGSLYPDKRLDFLCQALLLLRDRVPNFNFVFAGAGELEAQVAAFCRQNPWARAVGAVQGERKARLLDAADVLLCPAAVGLVVLDSFVAGVPMVTTRIDNHGPEIAYLRHGHNALVTEAAVAAYAGAVADLLLDPDRHRQLRQACLEDAGHYSVQQMAQRFLQGIQACLAAPPGRPPAGVAAI